MKHEIDHNQVTIYGVIEILNDLGYNIVHIDNTYYIFTEFIPVEEGMVEISVRGKNVTSIVENQTSTIGMDRLRQRELVDRIAVMKNRRRVFSPGTNYTKYIGSE